MKPVLFLDDDALQAGGRGGGRGKGTRRDHRGAEEQRVHRGVGQAGVAYANRIPAGGVERTEIVSREP
jgi:hypothetical protein